MISTFVFFQDKKKKVLTNVKGKMEGVPIMGKDDSLPCKADNLTLTDSLDTLLALSDRTEVNLLTDTT